MITMVKSSEMTATIFLADYEWEKGKREKDFTRHLFSPMERDVFSPCSAGILDHHHSQLSRSNFMQPIFKTCCKNIQKNHANLIVGLNSSIILKFFISLWTWSSTSVLPFLGNRENMVGSGMLDVQ